MNKQQFLSLIPDFKEIQESPLILEGKEVAFHSSVILRNNHALGSGFALSPMKARQIAFSEAIERRLVELNISSATKHDLLLDEYPTSCGFAVGNDRDATKQRALAEAVERWLRSKWIDDGYALLEYPLVISELNPIECHFASFFESVRLFALTCAVTFEKRSRRLIQLLWWA